MKFLLLLALLFSLDGHAQWYFGNGEAVNQTNGTAYKNGVKTIAGSLDPSTTAVSAPSGSMYYSTSGTIYVKQDAGLSTNWLPLGIATTGSLSTINGQSGPGVNIASGTAGSDFAVSASSNTITLDLPTASGTKRGALSSSDWTMFSGKQDAITGAASTVTTANLTANRAVISNGSGKIAASAVTDTELGYVGGVTSPVQSQLDAKEPTITATTSADYYRGDKTFQPLNKTAVGLPNVDNTSDLNKPVSTATQTALDGKIDGVASSVDSEVVLFNGTTGKASKRATGTGYAKLTSGVLSTSSTVAASDLTGQVALANGGTNKSLTAVSGGVVYTDSDSQEVTSAGISGQVLESNGTSAPSFKTKTFPVKSDAGLVVNAQRIIVPNKTLTNVTGSDYFIESGNKNILDDASFEGGNAAGVWALSGGTYVQDNSPVDGTYNAQLTISASSFAFSQDSTLYASQFADGVQGLAMARVRAPSTLGNPIYVCSRQAGSTASVSSGCVQVQANGKWGLYKVPFILGATSNGIIITSNGQIVNGDIEVDDAFLGAVDLKQDIDQSRIAGESYFAGTASCTWSRTSATLGAFTATAACPGPTISDSTMGSWQTTDSDLPRQTINNLPAGKYKAKFIFEKSNASSVSTVFTIFDGTSSCVSVPASSDNTQAQQTIVECVFSYTSSGNRSFELYAATTSGATNIINSRSSAPVTGTKFILEYFGSGSVYSATNADTDWASCGHTSSDFTGFGTVTSIETQCKRQGSDLLVKGKFTSGTVTATEARLNLRFNGTSLTSANLTKIPSLQMVGNMAYSGNGGYTLVTLIEPSTAYMTFGIGATSTNSMTKATGSTVSGSSATTSFDARVPISGWENSNVIIGTFNEVVTTPGLSKPVVFRARYNGATDTTVCSSSPCTTTEMYSYDWLNGNVTRTGSGAYSFTSNSVFAASSWVFCSASRQTVAANDGDGGDRFMVLANSSGVITTAFRAWNGAGTANDTFGFIECEGQAP